MNAVDVLRWHMNGDASRIEAKQALDRLARLVRACALRDLAAIGNSRLAYVEAQNEYNEALVAVLGEGE